MTFRILDTGINSARANIAATAGLLAARGEGRIPDTLRFHRYARAFLLGRHQQAAKELDVERCNAKGVEVARRLTGGAAVYMDFDILAWDFVTGSRGFGMGMPETSDRMSAAMVGALLRLGLSAYEDGHGDIIVAARKVGGAAGFFDGRTVLVQGMIFLALDRRRMAGLLRKQSDTRRAGIRVGSLADCLSRALSAEEVKLAVSTEMSQRQQVVA